MPTIRVELFAGRTLDQKRALAQALTEATVKALGGSADGVCGFVSAGRTCRAQDDLCDVAETCDGASPACPADEVVIFLPDASNPSNDFQSSNGRCGGRLPLNAGKKKVCPLIWTMTPISSGTLGWTFIL